MTLSEPFRRLFRKKAYNLKNIERCSARGIRRDQPLLLLARGVMFLLHVSITKIFIIGTSKVISEQLFNSVLKYC